MRESNRDVARAFAAMEPSRGCRERIATLHRRYNDLRTVRRSLVRFESVMQIARVSVAVSQDEKTRGTRYAVSRLFLEFLHLASILPPRSDDRSARSADHGGGLLMELYPPRWLRPRAIRYSLAERLLRGFSAPRGGDDSQRFNQRGQSNSTIE